jgi:hypothetical protein
MLPSRNILSKAGLNPVICPLISVTSSLSARLSIIAVRSANVVCSSASASYRRKRDRTNSLLPLSTDSKKCVRADIN